MCDTAIFLHQICHAFVLVNVALGSTDRTIRLVAKSKTKSKVDSHSNLVALARSASEDGRAGKNSKTSKGTKEELVVILRADNSTAVCTNELIVC